MSQRRLFDGLLRRLSALERWRDRLQIPQVYLPVSIADVDNPPTDAQLDAEFGTPSAVGAGFRAFIDDAGANTTFWYVGTNGTSWFTTEMPPGGGVGGNIPIGGIILWSGAVAAIPTGWALCNGSGGTPDLRDSFVIGAGSTYNPNDTGGSSTIDLAHTHGPGTLETDTDTHNHGPGTLETDSDTHDHTVDAGVTANDSHDHAVDAGLTSGGTGHAHGPGTLATGSASADDHPDVVDVSGPDTSERAHTHSVTSGATDLESGHTHGAGTLETDSDTHSHGPGTLETDTDAHDHTVDAGTTANDAHDHTVDAGVTASALADATSVLNPYYSLAYIMRIA